MARPDDIKFLLVDDLAENLLALEALLRRDGLQLVKARSGAEALELMLVDDFALALVDVQMPGIDGFELAELMRGTERTRRIPILFLTAVATDERRRFRGYEAGAVDYLLKPIDSTLLLNKVTVFHDLARQRQELARQRDELRQTAELQHLLIGELNHRVKNMLATVQAIASQTLRHAPSPADFSASFSGRIQAMARAHSLLSDATWEGARLAELIRDQLRLGAFDECRLSAGGPDLLLAPQLALHLALILHELATNAIKYGSLSGAAGEVRIAWSIEGKRLRLLWAEHGGPPAAAPAKRGFGTNLIEQSVKAQGGMASADYAPAGVRWEIELTLPATPGASAARARPATPEADERLNGATVTSSIVGRRVLVVEDEPLVALELTTILKEAGVEVLGPVASAEEVLACLEAGALDGALLDGNLRGRAVDDVAALLAGRGVPFAFVSGYEKDSLPQAHAEVPLLRKPFTVEQLLGITARLLGGA